MDDMEVSPSEGLHDSLKAYQPIWSEVKQRHDRSMVTTKYGVVCGDPELELAWQTSNSWMNRLLHRYYILISGVELQASITPELPANIQEEKDIAWTEYEET